MSSSIIRRGVTKRISYIRGKGSIFIFHNCNEESQDADWERSQNIYCDKMKDQKSEHCSDHECPLLWDENKEWESDFYRKCLYKIFETIYIIIWRTSDDVGDGNSWMYVFLKSAEIAKYYLDGFDLGKTNLWILLKVKGGENENAELTSEIWISDLDKYLRSRSWLIVTLYFHFQKSECISVKVFTIIFSFPRVSILIKGRVNWWLMLS